MLTRGVGFQFHDYKEFGVLNPSRPKRYYCTECFPGFFLNFACMSLLILVRLFSNLRCKIAHQLSFLKKIEVIYLRYRPFYHCSCTVYWLICLQKTSKKMCALLKNLNLYSNDFLNGKWYWKNSNRFELQSIDSSSCTKGQTWNMYNIFVHC